MPYVKASQWDQLDRYLLWGRGANSRGHEAVFDCIDEDGLRTVARILVVFHTWSAYSLDPAVFAVAACVACGDLHTRRAAAGIVSQVCYSLHELYDFNYYVISARGRGRIVNRAVASWFNNRTPAVLARQFLYYPEQDGWTVRDLLRLSHPVPPTSEHALLYQWACQGWDERLMRDIPETEGTALVLAHERAKRSKGWTVENPRY